MRLTEPVTNIPPKHPGRKFDGSLINEITERTTAVAVCEITGFPVPVFSVPPKIHDSRYQEKSVQMGSDGAMLCSSQAYPVPSFRWYKFIDGTSRKQAVTLNERVKQVSGTLIIKEAKVEDSGKYLCVVNNSVGGESVETVLTVTAPLSATIEPITQTVDFGRSATFSCNFQGNPIKTVGWLKDGKPLKHEEPVLRIESVKKDDKGMYQCFVRNDQESAQASAELKLGGRFEPPQIRHAFDEEILQPGTPVFLKCIASGNPTPEIAWELDGKKLSNNDRLHVGQYVTVNGDVVSHLNISSIHTNDGGLYKCIAWSKVGHTEHSNKLNVYGKPFVRPMEKKAIVAGEMLIVTCPVAGYPIDSIVWERDGRVLPINRKQKVFHNGTLIIENVERQSDQATYTCVAKNPQGLTSRGTLEVQVMVPPQILPFSFGETPSNPGDLVLVQCAVVKGDAPISIVWKFNQKALTEKNLGIEVNSFNKRVSSLTIESVSAAHAGNYTCTANNSAGIYSYTAQLVINGNSFGGNCQCLRCSSPSRDLPSDFSSDLGHRNTQHRTLKLILVLSLFEVPPQILPFSFGEETSNAGDLVAVQCSVIKGDLPISISWSLNNKSLADNSRGIEISRLNKRISTLSIDSVSAVHAGEYTCWVNNSAGVVSHSAQLHINALPHIVPFYVEEDLNTGESVQLNCHVTKGDKPIAITWTYNGEDLTAKMGVTTTKISERSNLLIISSVMATHSGNYTCTATNAAGTTSYTVPIRVNVLPHITPFSFDDEANFGDSVQLTCHVTKGDKPLDITWKFSGGNLSSQVGVTTTRVGDRTSLLTISSVMAEHNGNYSCVSTNAAGSVHHTAAIQVNDLVGLVVSPRLILILALPHITPFDVDDDINFGDSVQMNCHVSKGDLPVDIRWSFNGMNLTSSLGIITQKIGTRTSLLTISNVAEQHGGNYTCTAINAAGFANHTTAVHVKVMPYITPFTIEDEVNFGDMIQLNCLVSKGDRPITISWSFNELPLEENLSVTKTQVGDRASLLMISPVIGSHAGNYTCTAKNNAGSVNHTVAVHVNVLPYITPFEMDENVNFGDSVQLSCHVSKGDKPLNIVWDFHGKESLPDFDITTTRMGDRTSFLTISSVTAVHNGNYSCLASNSAGSTSHTTEIHVNVLPHIQPFSFDPINEGDLVITNCVVMKGDSPLEITWRYPGTSRGVLISKPLSRLSTLTIPSVTPRHAGAYTCIVRNPAGERRHTSVLRVNGSDFSGHNKLLGCCVRLHWENQRLPPKVLPFAFGENEFNAGQSATLQCTVSTGDLPLEISWQFAGLPENRRPEFLTSNFGKRVSILTIDSLTEQHVGNYTCTAKNSAGESSFTAPLQVNVLPQILPFDFGTRPMSPGETAQVTCLVSSGDQPLDITWSFEGRNISTLSGVSVSKFGSKASILLIDSVDAIHKGSYSCTVRNPAGRVNFTAVLRINVLPKIIPFYFDNPMNSGEAAQVTCLVSIGDLPLNISWSFGGQDISAVRGITTLKAGRKGSMLLIETVSAMHSGDYTCTVRNPAGSSNFTASLRINGKDNSKTQVMPKIVPFYFDNAMFSGEAAQVTCMVSAGDQPLHISWTFEGRNISSLRGVSTTSLGRKGSSLMIDPITADHRGNYTCTVRNPTGTSNFTASLNINVKPNIVPFHFEDPIFAGQATQVTCLISEGDLPLFIDWTFQESEVASLNGVTSTNLGKRMSVLLIEQAQYEHTGNYTCRASNSAGVSNYTATLYVNGKSKEYLPVLPKITAFDFGEDAIFSGQSAQASCFVSEGSEPVTISWSYQGKEIGTVKEISITKVGRKASILVIEPALSQHQGNYTCSAHNAAGTTNYTATLNINVLPKIVPFSFGDKPIFFGQGAQLTCYVSEGDAPIEIFWTFGGANVSSIPGVSTTQIMKKTSLLTIEPATSEHRGEYTCHARNSAGMSNHTASLSINVVPEVEPFSFNENGVNGGSSVRVMCSVLTGDQPLEITWLKDGAPLPEYSRKTQKLDDNTVILSLRKLTLEDSGTYTCIAKNNAGNGSHSSLLRGTSWWFNTRPNWDSQPSHTLHRELGFKPEVTSGLVCLSVECSLIHTRNCLLSDENKIRVTQMLVRDLSKLCIVLIVR
ncbi:hypothetical protein RUM43_011256 [Polyplax serrata]|uniref:Ig-like domain-containing protein n=1 Tax=Polyplax serrata TaxID=468196 RepID=A0AAN8S0Y6_POLSC